VPNPGFVDYSGAAPLLLPVSLLPHWHGFFVPAKKHDVADLEIPEGRFKICADFDFKNPKTDYDRACALGGVPAVQQLRVGPGYGLVFATELDNLTWWQERLMLVNGGSLPDPALLKRVEWSDECSWRATEPAFVLMNACQHGGSPDLGPHFKVQLEPDAYVVQWGQYGWADDDPAMILFQFVRRGSG
jgi:hypothetical protein